MTNARYYEECGFTRDQQRRKKRLNKQSAQVRSTLDLATLVDISFKASCLGDWLASWTALKPKLAACFKFYGHRSFCNDKFWSYGRKKQCLERLKADLVAKGGRKDVILAFEMAGFPHRIAANEQAQGTALPSFWHRRCGW